MNKLDPKIYYNAFVSILMFLLLIALLVGGFLSIAVLGFKFYHYLMLP